MAYCTKQNLIDRYSETELIQLTDRAGVGVIDDAVLNQAIADATAEIDGFIVRYLPLAVVPTVLVRIACDISRYHLYDDAMIDTVEKRYNDARRFLEAVAKGLVSLGVDSAGAELGENDSVIIQSDNSVFGR